MSGAARIERTSERRSYHSDGNALDGERLAPQIDDDRLEVRVLGDQFRASAFQLQALHGHVIAKTSHDDLPGLRL